MLTATALLTVLALAVLVGRAHKRMLVRYRPEVLNVAVATLAQHYGVEKLRHFDLQQNMLWVRLPDGRAAALVTSNSWSVEAALLVRGKVLGSYSFPAGWRI